jgi:hypothetical protein
MEHTYYLKDRDKDKRSKVKLSLKYKWPEPGHLYKKLSIFIANVHIRDGAYHDRSHGHIHDPSHILVHNIHIPRDIRAQQERQQRKKQSLP